MRDRRRGEDGEVDQLAVVAGLRREELGVEGAHLALPGPFERPGEELEALARARLDQRPHEQAIDLRPELRPPGLGRRLAPEPRDVRIDRRGAEGQPARFEEREDAEEVIHLLTREERERADHGGDVGVARGEGERVRRRLHLAVGVVHEDAPEITHRFVGPRRIRLRLEAQHRGATA